MATTEARAAELGAEHGRNAASWYFDGNTTRETYARVLRGIEDGDPEVLDTFPGSPLSGEWADDPTPQTLADELGIEGGDELAEACTAYEDAFYLAVQESIESAARYQLSED